MFIRKTLLHSLLLLPLAALPVASHATTTVSSQFNVTITLTNACSFGANAADLAFGSHGVLDTVAGAPFNAMTQLNVTCTNNYAASIVLDNGSNASGTQRRMKGGTEYVNYNLYSDSGHTTAWSSTSPVTYTGVGTAQTVTVYGQVPAQATPSAGSYSDVVTASISF